MVVIRVLAATVMALVACAPACALDVPVRGSKYGYGSAPEGPILTADGTVIVGLYPAKTGRFTVVAFSPTLKERQTLMSFDHPPRGYGASRKLTAAGHGFLITDDVGSVAGHCCGTHYLRGAVTWFPSVGEPGQVIRSCPVSCGTSNWNPLYFTASDGQRAFMLDELPASGQPHAIVRDLASGAETAVALNTGGVQPGTGNHAPQLAGAFLSYPPAGTVINWQTSEVVRRVPYIAAHGLLADGTLIYEDHELWKDDDRLLRWPLGDPDPTPYPRPGALLAVANDRVLVQNTTGLEIWTPDGTLVSNLGSYVPSLYAFDGSRLVTVEDSCMTVRIQVRSQGIPTGQPLPGLCATPRIRSGTLNPHSATAKVTCPARYAQGCIGKVSLVVPRPPGAKGRLVTLHPGQIKTVRLARWTSAKVCSSIRRVKHWHLTVTTPRADLDPSVTPFRIGRRARCDKGG